MANFNIPEGNMTRIAVVFAFVLAVIVPVRAEDKVGESPLYPLKIGTTWNYKIGDQKLTAKVTKHEMNGGLMCALVETTVNGQPAANEHIAVTKDGDLVRTSFAGQTPEKPLMFLKAKAKNGESWDIDNKVMGQEIKGKFTRGEEDVDVPGYKGKTITSKGEFTIMGMTISFAYWFAEKKGIVKSQVSANGQTFTMELESFEEGK
jgi:hypothetical protein